MIFLFIILFLPLYTQAQELVEISSREVRATVIEIIDQSDQNGIKQMKFKAKGDDSKIYTIDTNTSYVDGLRYNIEIDKRVILQILPEIDGSETAHLSDVVRSKAIYWMAILFAVATIAVGLWRGFFALLGLTVTILIVFVYVLPQILAGSDPVTVTILASFVILAINMHLSHGFSRSTIMAFLGTVIGLGLVWIFANLFTNFADLSGLASEEANFLIWDSENFTNVKGLLLSGIILGAVGVLDDITVAQAEIVNEIREANPNINKRELFKSAMRVGRHHISSTVNTLVLAYIGVALPLFLLFYSSTISTEAFINTELVAEEITRTLSGTLALVLTVPIATWLSTSTLTIKKS